MTVLNDTEIERRIKVGKHEADRYDGDPDRLMIEPYDPDHVQPASYDLTLGNEWEVPVQAHPDDLPIKPDEGLPDSAKRVYEAEEFVLNSMQNPDVDGSAFDSRPFVLGHVEEYIRIPSDLTAEVKGRSSVGRLGVIPHTAGWGDPGFEGQLTLEFVNLSPNPIQLESGMRIAQVVFEPTDSPAANTYGAKEDSKYQGQTGVTESRIEEDQ